MLLSLYMLLILFSPFVLIIYGGLYVLPKLLAKLLHEKAQPPKPEPRSSEDHR